MNQPHKMVKHTQTIHWQQPTNCWIVFNHFWGLVLKELMDLLNKITFTSKLKFMPFLECLCIVIKRLSKQRLETFPVSYSYV